MPRRRARVAGNLLISMSMALRWTWRIIPRFASMLQLCCHLPHRSCDATTQQSSVDGFKNNLMTDGSPFPSWSGCGRGLHQDRVGLMRRMATRQRHLVSPRAALATASRSQHVPCTTKRASAITKPLATHVTRSSTCLFSS